MQLWTVLSSSPDLRAAWQRLPHHADTMPVIGTWMGTEEPSQLHQFENFGGACDFAVKHCQQHEEAAVVVFRVWEVFTEEAAKSWLWEAPFTSYMDAKRALTDVPSWTWTRDKDGMHGHASVFGPYPQRLDAHKDCQIYRVYAALVGPDAQVSELSHERYSLALV